QTVAPIVTAKFRRGVKFFFAGLSAFPAKTRYIFRPRPTPLPAALFRRRCRRPVGKRVPNWPDFPLLSGDVAMPHPMFSQEEVDVWTVVKKGTVKTRKTALGDIHIDLEGGYIHFIQRWKYVWIIDKGAPVWTYDDQADYHYLLKSEIWTDWD